MWEFLFLPISPTTSARKPKDEDSLSVTERSLDVQPRNRIPRSKQRVRGQGHKPGRDYSEVKEIDTSIVSAEYDTQSISSMEVSSNLFSHTAVYCATNRFMTVFDNW